jgi:uncharacterized membrane protein
MLRWANRFLAVLLMVGGVLMIIIKDEFGHPVGISIPQHVTPWLSWIIFIVGFAYFLISFFKE